MTLLLAAFLASTLQQDLQRLTAGFPGRVGVCVRDASGTACVNGDQRFSLQSVMKLVAGLAFLEGVDQGRFHLDEPITIRKQDLSVFVQPIMDLVGKDGYRTTLDDLMRRAIVQSDSAAVDNLMAKIGGPTAVQAFLDRHAIAGMRIDRDERHLQTEILGLQWRPEYVDPAALDRATKAVPAARAAAAYQRYQRDARDTSTPAAMALLLQSLAEGKLLSPASTRHVLEVMSQTVTFPDRLKAGVPAGWTIAHKTGTSGSWKGVTAATNDVGILTAPDGRVISVAVFIADSPATSEKKAALMASIARAVAVR